MKEYSRLTERFSYLGGYKYNRRIKGILIGLGFADSEFECNLYTVWTEETEQLQ